MKQLANLFTLLVLLSTSLTLLLPTGSVFAAKDPGSITLVIHNDTGGKVSFDLRDAAGGHHPYSLSTGQTSLTLAVATYGYYATLPCGIKTGEVNLSVGKQLYLFCGSGDNLVVRKTAGRNNLYCYNIYDVYSLEDRDYLKGTRCQDTPASEYDIAWYEAHIPGYGTENMPMVYFTSINNVIPGKHCLPDLGQGYYGLDFLLVDVYFC